LTNNTKFLLSFLVNWPNR